MRLGVVGSRSWTDRKLFWRWLCAWLREHPDLHLVSGGARNGPDRLAEEFARQKGLPITIYHAKWDEGKHAGFERNTKIVEDCDCLMAFRYKGKSNGTDDSVTKARARGISVYVIDPEGNVT